MAIRIPTYEKLVEKLDEDTQWRKKELADMQVYCGQSNCPPSFYRAAFVLCCAHFEGSVKYASNAYVAYISAQNIRADCLRTEISAIAVRKHNYQFFSYTQAKKVKVSVVSKVLEAYCQMVSETFFVKVSEDDMPLPTEGNPTPEVLREILNVLGIDYDKLFLLREPFINSELLSPRHSVAHGERRPITSDELSAATQFVLEVMDEYKNSILEAAAAKSYLKRI